MLHSRGGGSRSRPCKVAKWAEIGDDWPSMSSTVPGLYTSMSLYGTLIENGSCMLDTSSN